MPMKYPSGVHAENERRDGTDQMGKQTNETDIRVYGTRIAAVTLKYDGEKGSGRKE